MNLKTGEQKILKLKNREKAQGHRASSDNVRNVHLLTVRRKHVIGVQERENRLSVDGF